MRRYSSLPRREATLSASGRRDPTINAAVASREYFSVGTVRATSHPARPWVTVSIFEELYHLARQELFPIFLIVSPESLPHAGIESKRLRGSDPETAVLRMDRIEQVIGFHRDEGAGPASSRGARRRKSTRLLRCPGSRFGRTRTTGRSVPSRDGRTTRGRPRPGCRSHTRPSVPA